MSYILEALKKSQAERELGRVPTLDSVGLLDEERPPPGRSPWPMVAVGLAALATLIALYAALRGPATAPISAPAPPVSAAAVPAPAAPVATAAPPPGTSPAPLALQDLGHLSVGQRPLIPAPQVSDGGDRSPPAMDDAPPLVEPPPPKRLARPTPVGSVAYPERGTPPGTPEATAAMDAEAALDAELEAELERSLAAEAAGLEPPPELAEDPQEDPPTPIPRDLIDDIEAFKNVVRGDKAGPSSPKRSAKAAEDPTKLRLTLEQEADLPAYLMTVHVYDAETAKRFIVINGVKYWESEQTREGLMVDRILANGAVLRYQGNPFYVER